jgi:hypothetical protein
VTFRIVAEERGPDLRSPIPRLRSKNIQVPAIAGVPIGFGLRRRCLCRRPSVA